MWLCQSHLAPPSPLIRLHQGMGLVAGFYFDCPVAGKSALSH